MLKTTLNCLAAMIGLALMILAPAMTAAQTFPGAATVGFAQECFVPVVSKKDPSKVLYWNILVSCTADRVRTNGAADRAEAEERLELLK